MRYIRKIIEERLENARNDYENNLDEHCLEEEKFSKLYTLQGQIEAYQDCLNLLPAPRTEQDILNDFEKLGWVIYENTNLYTILNFNAFGKICINKANRTYVCNCGISMQEHKLLSELFEVWGWK